MIRTALLNRSLTEVTRLYPGERRSIRVRVGAHFYRVMDGLS